MVDFGLAGFLDKFEERFGKKATTGLLLLIGVAIASVCINTFYSMAVRPVFSSIASIWSGQAFGISGYWDLLKSVVILILVLALASSIWRNILFKKQSVKNMDTIGKMIGELIAAVHLTPDQINNLRTQVSWMPKEND